LTNSPTESSFICKPAPCVSKFCTNTVIHVTYAPQWPPPNHLELSIIKKEWPAVPWDAQSDSKTITLSTAQLKLVINRQDSVINYLDAAGKSLLAEGPKKMSPVTVNGEQTFHAEDVFKVYGSEEAFYGLGQHQAGVFNMRGESVDLSQENTNIAIPFFVSTKRLRYLLEQSFKESFQ
jgi:alpha-D-xyloside xylohydrolase